MILAQMSKEQLEQMQQELLQQYEGYKAKQLNLNMARGKPSAAQLDLSMPMLTCLNDDYLTADGTDVRNYGVLDGIPEAKALFAELLDVPAANVIVGGASSLNLMYDTVARNMMFGVADGMQPWGKQGTIKFLCPSPGYDRHFAITEQFGIEMVPIAMYPDGPDMDSIERLVAIDPGIKGIWCVPQYSNPQGITYSDEVVRRFASLKPAAADFRIFWDNAYAVHHLDMNDCDQLANIYTACQAAGTQDMVYIFTSTSKVTFAGAGISCLAASDANIAHIKKYMTVQTIGHDKINQLRHVRFLQNKAGVMAHMAKHAAILKPKFDVVLDTLQNELAPLDCAHWTAPKGGYFIAVDVMPGCAKRVVELCRAAGVTLTGAGATYPYGRDPEDSNIRLAPSLPPVAELQVAIALFCLCVKLASIEKLLSE